MRRSRLLAAFIIGTIGMVRPATAQDAQPASPEKGVASDLQKEADAFVKALQERPEFDEEAKKFVTKVALLKLRQVPDQRRLAGTDKLEAALDRIRDGLSGPKGVDAAAGQQIREAAATWLVEQARSADPAVAANAALLLGDLRAEGKPWIEGSRRLAELAANAEMQPAVRAAAVAGLSRQAEELFAGKAPPPPEFADAIAPALAAIVTAPAPAADPAGRWLVSRALDVVARVVPAASPDLARALMTIMADPSRSTDERVRAAIALGRTATKESGIDAAAAVKATWRLAAEALADSLATAKDRALAASLSGMPVPTSPQPGLPEAGPAATAYPLDEVEVRRDAWRLLKLSEAIARPKFKKDKSGGVQALWNEPAGGLALLLDERAQAVAMATQLRAEAEALVETPEAARVAEARETIASSGP